MISPVSLKENTKLLKTIQSEEVVDLYKKASGIDISYLKGITPDIKLYKCNDSGYFFFSPAATAGNGAFYAELSKQPWYYSETRWEHTKALELLPEKGNLLEMGCGSGFFLNMLKEKRPQIKATGLEINEKAIGEGRSKGLDMINEDVISYAKAHPGRYDFVGSFQVMEHIYNVREVLAAQLELLRKGGWLFVGVPNNDSYVGRNQHVSRCLNMPPHHMGLWSQELFGYIEREFNLKRVGLFEEPFSEKAYLVWHYTHMLKLFRTHWLVKAWFALKLPQLLKGPFLSRYRKKEPGHTLLAVFEKTGNG